MLIGKDKGVINMECRRCLMGTDVLSVTLDNDGICQYCHLHDRLNNEEPISEERERMLAKRINDTGGSKKYNCIVGVSGGSDSSFLLYWAKKMKLRPLAVHFDNGWNTEEAKYNMQIMTSTLDIDLHTVYAPKEYDDMNRAFLLASTPEADIPNDILLLLALLDTAKSNGIKYIINGHNFRTEGTAPLSWTLMDSQYIYDVYNKFVGKKLNIKLMTLWEQIKYRMSGIQSLRPLYNIGSSKSENKILLKDFGWKDYGGIHTENIYTSFVGSYLLPYKFKIDKRRIYYSANIRAGALSKEEAKQKINCDIHYPESYYDMIEDKYFNGILEGKSISDIMKLPVKSAMDYGNYYKKYVRYGRFYRMGIKVGMFPKTFEKYINEANRIVGDKIGK